MSIENDVWEWLSMGHISEQTQESQEQYQEQAKKAQAQLQKVKKDEKKSQWDNEKLFDLLQKFIQDPYYQDLIPTISHLLSLSTPSRALIGLLGLFYPDAAYYMTYITGRIEKIQIMIQLHRSEEMVDFDENALDPSIRAWITEWVSLIEKFLFHPSASLVMNQKFHTYLKDTHPEIFRNAIAQFFIFFFATRNIRMSEKIGQDYARFIQDNLITAAEKHLHENDHDPLLQSAPLEPNDLFGMW